MKNRKAMRDCLSKDSKATVSDFKRYLEEVHNEENASNS